MASNVQGPRAVPWLIVLGVLVGALSFRAPVIAVSPVLRDIERDLGIGSATAGLLTSAPVLAFALLTPFAALLIRRAGSDLALMITLAGVLLGTVVRAGPGYGWMLAGMIIIGVSITIGNVVVPVIIRREVPKERVSFIMALYVATMNGGSLLVTLATAPLATVLGWSGALLLWASMTLLGVGLWGMHVARGRRAGTLNVPSSPASQARTRVQDLATGAITVPTGTPGSRAILRQPVIWLLAFAFGAQALLYYALSTWLPTLTSDLLGIGLSGASALAALYQGAAIVGAFVVPAFAKVAGRYGAPIVICLSWLILAGGLLYAPQHIWLWLTLGAVGHAGGFVVVFAGVVQVARSDAEATTGSAVIQGIGYGISAAGAPLLGALHEETGGWQAPLTVVLVIAVAYCVMLLGASVAAGRIRR